jgi:hypothetical protein
MSNLMNTADGLTPPILNPESVTWYDTLYEVEHCYAVDKLQQTTNHGIFLELLPSADSIAYHCAILQFSFE